MFAGHLDVVGIEGMTHAPFDAEIRQGRIFGRGSADMKAGLSAMCAAAALALDEAGRAPARQILIAAVADEEYASLGMRRLVESGVSAEMAILTEPTRLAICPAHRGFVWAELELTGRAAHGSRYDIGVDAIRHAALVLAELDEVEATVLPERLIRSSAEARCMRRPSRVAAVSPLIRSVVSWSSSAARSLVNQLTMFSRRFMRRASECELSDRTFARRLD